MTPAGCSRFQPNRVSRRARGPQDRDAPPDGGGLRPVLTAAARAALLPSGRDGETDLSRTEKQPFTPAAALAGIGQIPGGPRFTAGLLQTFLLGIFLLIGRNIGNHAFVERDLLHLARHVAQINQEAIHLGYPHNRVLIQ
jgi:hypothetical protein